MQEKIYTKGSLNVIWKSDLCIHSGNCVRGLSEVFNPRRRPWIELDAAEQDQIIEQVKKCPSGALSYTLDEVQTSVTASGEGGIRITAIPNGPLQVDAPCEVTLANGDYVVRTNKSFFCRCGASSNKPFCDGSHKKIGFSD